MPATEKTKNSRLVDTTYEAICASLSTGRIRPGDWLRQATLAEELGVSQVTVREALNKLIEAGLAERTPRKGVRVPYISFADLRDIYEMRLVAEGLAWEAAAERITAGELAHMRALLPDTGTTADPKSVEIARQKNQEFHLIAIRASGRWTLIRLLSQLLNLNNLRYLLSASSVETRVSDGLINRQEHAALLEALESREVARCRELIVSHIKRSMADRLALYGQAIQPE